MVDSPRADFWNKHRRGAGSFLDKEELSETGEQFRITNVRTGSGQYGPQWYLVVDRENRTAEGDTDEIISFPRSDNREEMFTDLKTAVSDGEIITAKIVTFVNKRGQTGFDLAPVDDPNDPNDIPF